MTHQEQLNQGDRGWEKVFYDRWYRGNEQHPHVMFAHHTMEDMIKDIQHIAKEEYERGKADGLEIAREERHYD